MEYFKNKSQVKQAAKVVISGIIIFTVIYWIVHLSKGNDKEEVKTCEPTISVRKMGQFGNQIWEYMSLYVVWQANFKIMRNYNLTPYIEEDMKNNLESLFENLTIPSFPKIYGHCDERETVIISKEETFQLPENMHKRNVLLASYSARYEDVVEFGIENIKKEIRFRENYMEEAMRIFDAIRIQYRLQNNETTFVGMHYRGGDYIPHLKGNHGHNFKDPPNYSFYTGAMDYFKFKYDNLIFILVTIDAEWLKNNERKIRDHGRVVVNPTAGDRNMDLTLLSHCNHSIINYGTFGVTAALLAQGDTIVYDLNLPLDYRGDTVALGLTKLLPGWMARTNLN